MHGKDKLVLVYSRDVKDEIFLHDLSSGSRIKRIGADMVGTVGQLSGRKEDDEFWFSFSNFVSPGQIFRFVPT